MDVMPAESSLGSFSLMMGPLQYMNIDNLEKTGKLWNIKTLETFMSERSWITLFSFNFQNKCASIYSKKRLSSSVWTKERKTIPPWWLSHCKFSLCTCKTLSSRCGILWSPHVEEEAGLFDFRLPHLLSPDQGYLCEWVTVDVFLGSSAAKAQIPVIWKQV